MEFRLLLHVVPDLNGWISLHSGAARQQKRRQYDRQQRQEAISADPHDGIIGFRHPTTTSTVPAPTLFICSTVFCASNLGSFASMTRMKRSSVARCAIR